MPRNLRHKYGAKASEVDSIRFPSRLEAAYYQKLKLLQKAGAVLFFLRQVPIELPGNTTYRVDFVEFWAPKYGEEAGQIRWVDCKGYETEIFKLKKRQVEEFYFKIGMAIAALTILKSNKNYIALGEASFDKLRFLEAFLLEISDSIRSEDPELMINFLTEDLKVEQEEV